ncbi:Uncharacterised protein [Porphyromonas crevioricanis]|uniref:Uncharacterized protein n=1 Tax=Porphyromonas crevioricanis TaxID=393921 RepID=A0A2X4PG43_9PORP|nr:Uncharacterised protein [Porphyromonas crevioricanis]
MLLRSSVQYSLSEKTPNLPLSFSAHSSLFRVSWFLLYFSLLMGKVEIFKVPMCHKSNEVNCFFC